MSELKRIEESVADVNLNIIFIAAAGSIVFIEYVIFRLELHKEMNNIWASISDLMDRIQRGRDSESQLRSDILLVREDMLAYKNECNEKIDAANQRPKRTSIRHLGEKIRPYMRKKRFMSTKNECKV